MQFWKIGLSAVLLAACSTAVPQQKMPITVSDPAQAGAQGPDQGLKNDARRLVEELDKSNLDNNSMDPFNTRLAPLLIPHRMEDGLNLDFRVYNTNDVTALAFPDGSIRLSYGLLSLVSDNEILYLVAREIGHIKLGHSKRRFEEVLSMAASSSPAGEPRSAYLVQRYVEDPFTEDEQRDADMYGLRFLRKHGYQVSAAPKALSKLAAVERQTQFGTGKESLQNRRRLIEGDAERMNAWDNSRGRMKSPAAAPVRNAPVLRQFKDEAVPPRLKSA